MRLEWCGAVYHALAINDRLVMTPSVTAGRPWKRLVPVVWGFNAALAISLAADMWVNDDIWLCILMLIAAMLQLIVGGAMAVAVETD